MKYITFLLLSFFFMDISYSLESVEQETFNRNFMEQHISTPLENLSILEKIASFQKLEYLKNISSNDFIKSPDFNLLSELLKENKINSGYIVEKRIKYFNKLGSKDLLKVIFEKRNSNWIPVEIKDGKNLLPSNHSLFNIALPPTSDDFQFEEFAVYWQNSSGKNSTIVPNSFNDAIINHVVFWGDSYFSSKKIKQVLSITMRYFLPAKTTKNGWLITDVATEKNNPNYDLNKQGSYTPPFRLTEIPNIDNVEMKYDKSYRGMDVKIKSDKNNSVSSDIANQVSKISCSKHEDKRFIRIAFETNTKQHLSNLLTRDASGIITINLQPTTTGFEYNQTNCAFGLIKINVNNIIIETINTDIQPSYGLIKNGVGQYLDLKY